MNKDSFYIKKLIFSNTKYLKKRRLSVRATIKSKSCWAQRSTASPPSHAHTLAHPRC